MPAGECLDKMLLLDLASMAGLLSRPGAGPRTVATARAVVARTAAHLGR